MTPQRRVTSAPRRTHRRRSAFQLHRPRLFPGAVPPGVKGGRQKLRAPAGQPETRGPSPQKPGRRGAHPEDLRDGRLRLQSQSEVGRVALSRSGFSGRRARHDLFFFFPFAFSLPSVRKENLGAQGVTSSPVEKKDKEETLFQVSHPSAFRKLIAARQVGPLLASPPWSR